MRSGFSATALAFGAALLAGGSAFAAGGLEALSGDSSDGGAAPPPNWTTGDDLTTCAPGKLWDVKGKVCVEERRGALPDWQVAEYAYALAQAGRYEEALGALDLLDKPDTARALNYRGYATRKLGRTQEGVTYYLKAVELDPNYVQVREYLGEAYVTLGKYDLAKAQLGEIRRICGNANCVEYAKLAKTMKEANAL